MKKFLLVNILLLSVFCINAYAQEPVNLNDEFAPVKPIVIDTIYTLQDVDEKPQFVGGDRALMRWLNENISYPIYAQEFGIQGKVLVNFVVEKDGRITNVKIEKGVHQQSLDREAIRLVKLMPKWQPAIKDEKVVRCYFTLPVTFVLR